MADHFRRTQDDATWTTGNYVTPVADWRDLSRKIFRAVNGDKGGTWSPRPWSNDASNQQGIVVGGSGMKVTGQTKIDYGGKILFEGGAQLILGNNDWPLLGSSHVGRSRSIVTSTMLLQNRSRFHWLLNRQYMAMQSVACTFQLGNILTRPEFSLPLRVHNGARLTKATLRYRIPKDFRRVPYLTPKMRILRVDEFGIAVPLMSRTAGADKDGFFAIPDPASPSDWFSKGNVKVFEYACDQYNTIDTSLYHYYAHVIEEQSTAEIVPIGLMDGEKERAIFFVNKVVFTNINESTDIDIDGRPSQVAASGESPFLVMGQGDTLTKPGEPNNAPIGNGVYFLVGTSVSISGRVRWTALDNVPGLILLGPKINVDNVNYTEQTAWELKKPSADTTVEACKFDYPTPRGNIYHSVTCDFDSIVDMRPQ